MMLIVDDVAGKLITDEEFDFKLLLSPDVRYAYLW